MVTVTDVAAAKFIEISKLDGDENKAVRVRVVGGGCAGFSYDLAYDADEPAELDEQFTTAGVRFLIDPLSMQYLDGVTIDYVITEVSEGFKFINPNSKGSCGCGNSFSA